MPDVLVGKDKAKQRELLPLEPDLAWRLLTWFAVLFLCAGIVDTGLALIPFFPGDAGWRFNTGVGVISGLPVMVLGLAGLTMASGALGRVWGVVAVAVLAAAMILAVVVLLFFVVSSVAGVVEASDVAAQPAVKKGAVRAVLLGLAYGVVAAVALRFGVVYLRQPVES